MSFFFFVVWRGGGGRCCVGRWGSHPFEGLLHCTLMAIWWSSVYFFLITWMLYCTNDSNHLANDNRRWNAQEDDEHIWRWDMCNVAPYTRATHYTWAKHVTTLSGLANQTREVDEKHFQTLPSCPVCTVPSGQTLLSLLISAWFIDFLYEINNNSTGFRCLLPYFQSIWFGRE